MTFLLFHIITLLSSAVRKTENRFGFQKTEPNRTEAKFQNRHVGFPKFPRVCPKPKERRR